MENESLKVYVLFRSSKKTGNIDTCVTALGNALLQMWALNNTPASKMSLIFERESGKLIFAAYGKKDNMPEVKKNKDGLGFCEEFGISLEDLHDIRDDRFDN